MRNERKGNAEITLRILCDTWRSLRLNLINEESQNMPAKKIGSQKLNSLKPSSKKDESFFELVFEVVRQIPKGRVTSYGAIANALGTKLSARMVGWAMNGSHRVKPKVPAHRVVNRQGLLTGKIHFDPPEKMQQLLEKEGIVVKDDQIQNFQKIFWDPLIELSID